MEKPTSAAEMFNFKAFNWQCGLGGGLEGPLIAHTQKKLCTFFSSLGNKIEKYLNLNCDHLKFLVGGGEASAPDADYRAGRQDISDQESVS